MFCESLRKHAMKIINFGKNKNMPNIKNIVKLSLYR